MGYELFYGIYWNISTSTSDERRIVELISKCRKMLQRQCIPLVRLGGLVCLSIQQVRHAEAVNSNLTNQLKRGNFEIASVGSTWFTGG
jgi:hypothetical protein